MFKGLFFMSKISVRLLLFSSALLMLLSSCGSDTDVITASSDFKTRRFTHWYTAKELDAINQCTNIFKSHLTSSNLNPRNNAYAENQYITDHFYQGNDYCYDLYEHKNGEISVLRSMYFRFNNKDGLDYQYSLKAVENNRPNAITNMARYHLNMKEYKAAIKWFTKSYEMTRNPNSAYENGYIYDKYLGDYNSAVVWYKIAYVSKQPIASYDIGVMYDTQLKDHIEGIKWFRIAQKQGYKGMNFKIARAYRDLKKYSLAVYHYERDYDRNQNPQSALELARIYGHDGYKDYTKSARWYIKAYELSNNPKLLMVVGDIYNYKLKRYGPASRWYIQALEAHQKEAVMKLANMYNDKVRNYSKAIKYYKIAIDIYDNRNEAPQILGDILNFKLRDPSQAVPWYEMSAQAGNDIAGYNLGYLYEHQLQDFAHAKIWYTVSAKLKNKKSALALARIYRDVYKDLNNAHKWFAIAEKLPDAPTPADSSKK